MLAPAPDDDETWGGPMALASASAAAAEVVVWFHALGADDAMEIRRVVSSDGGATFGAATVALADARDPSVARAADGSLWMAYADAGGLGLATGADGVTFEPTPSTGLPADASEPSLVLDGDRFVVFAVQADAIVRLEAGPDLAFGAPEVVLAPESGCVDAFGKDKPCWDEAALSGPDVRLATTAAGRRVWRMFFAGRSGNASDLGFAASFDGRVWSRYVFDPVLKESTSELAPSCVFAAGDYLLFYVDQRSTSSAGIALGRVQSTSPSERW
ncbi:MAG: hypothetical protein U1F43_10725 [Myxococcota bacterium]